MTKPWPRKIVASRPDLIFSSDGEYTAAGDGRGPRLWDVESGRDLGRFDGHTDAITGVAFSPDGQQVLSCGADGLMILWRLPAR